MCFFVKKKGLKLIPKVTYFVRKTIGLIKDGSKCHDSESLQDRETSKKNQIKEEETYEVIMYKYIMRLE